MSEEHEGGIYPAPTEDERLVSVGAAYMPPASRSVAAVASPQVHVHGFAVNVNNVVNEGWGGPLPRVNG